MEVLKDLITNDRGEYTNLQHLLHMWLLLQIDNVVDTCQQVLLLLLLLLLYACYEAHAKSGRRQKCCAAHEAQYPNHPKTFCSTVPGCVQERC